MGDGQADQDQWWNGEGWRDDETDKKPSDPRDLLTYRYQDGVVLYNGNELKRSDFIEPLAGTGDFVKEGTELSELVCDLRDFLHQELIRGWGERGDIDFGNEFGFNFLQEIQDILARGEECEIAFFGSAGGAAIRDVFDLDSTEKLKVHEFALTDSGLKKSPVLADRVVDGSLVVHLGPVELVPLNVSNLRFIFSRAGPFYHTLERFIPFAIKKAVLCLAVGGKAVIQTKSQSLSDLADVLGRNFSVKEIARPNYDEGWALWGEAWYEIVRVA